MCKDKWVPKKGEVVLVSDSTLKNAEFRIFVEIDKNGSYVCVANSDVYEFFHGEEYDTIAWKNAYPIPEYQPKILVKSAEDIIKTLKSEGYEIDEYGSWLHHNSNDPSFEPEMFFFCEKERPNVFEWKRSWLKVV